MLIRASIAFLLALLSLEPVWAQTVGQKFSGAISLPTNIQSKLYVPLPKGNWQVIATGHRRSSLSNVNIPRIFLAQVKAKKLFGLIRIDFNQEAPDYGWNAPKDCTRENIFFLTPDASTFYNPTRGYNCLSINHAGMTTGRKATQAAKDAYSWVWKNTMSMPRFMIKATFSLSDGSQFLHVRYYRSPDAEGFPPSRSKRWRASEWHYDILPGDPTRLAYVNKIKDWAIAWKPRVEAGFHGR